MVSNEFISKLGLSAKEDLLVGEYEDYYYSYADSVRGFLFEKGLIFVFPNPLNLSIRKEIKKLVNAPYIRLLAFNKQNDTVFVTFPTKQFKNRSEDEYIQACLNIRNDAVKAFKTLNLHQSPNCFICGQGFSENTNLVKKAYRGCYVPVHQECADQLINYTAQQIQNEKSSNLPISILLAAVGSAIGIIPTILSIIFLERIFALLYALIPLAAYYGYKMGNAPRNKSMIVIIILLSIVVLLGFDLILWNITATSDGFPSIFEALKRPEYQSAVLEDIGIHILFLFLGIMISWRVITSTSDKQMKEVNKLK